MPTVEDFGSVKIAVHAKDHPPPHYHVISAEFDLSVNILTNEIIKPDKISKKMRDAAAEALAWGADNRKMLSAKWLELHAMR